jgi:hypothetical protein
MEPSNVLLISEEKKKPMNNGLFLDNPIRKCNGYIFSCPDFSVGHVKYIPISVTTFTVISNKMRVMDNISLTKFSIALSLDVK